MVCRSQRSRNNCVRVSEREREQEGRLQTHSHILHLGLWNRDFAEQRKESRLAFVVRANAFWGKRKRESERTRV